MIKNQAILIFIILIIIAVLAWVFITREDDNQTEHQDKIKATMYKSPTCGCCVEYTEYLKKQGFEVEVIKTEDMASIKDEHQIPSNMESCHTLVIDNYFIEGHAPVEAINQLLAEKPAIDGISLPDMPSGSPGMPGFKQEEFKIFKLLNGQVEPFINL